MHNKTIYKRKTKSDSLLGGWKLQTVTRKAHNRKTSYVKRKNITLGWPVWFLVWTVGFSYGLGMGTQTIDFRGNFIHPIVEAQEVSAVTPQLEQAEGEALAEPLKVEAGQDATPSAYLSEKQQILSYIVEVFGDDADRAIWMAKCESGLRANALNDKNSNGTTDYGVFQINSVHIKRYGDGFTKDWKENVRVAKQIFEAHGKSFRPWVCAKSIGEKNYLQ